MSHAQQLSVDLLLANLSKQDCPAIQAYRDTQVLDLSQVTKIDSAGVAYLVQIKIRYPALLLTNAPEKLRVLAALYGVENFFEK